MKTPFKAAIALLMCCFRCDFHKSIIALSALMLACASSKCSAGRVFVWGTNVNGETNVPPGMTNVLSLAGGSYHYLALRADGTVVAWGLNTYGQTNVPADVVNPSEISAGMDHSLVLEGDGTIRMWGDLLYSGSNAPPSATNLAVIAQGPGAEHLFGLRQDGSLFAYGGIAGESVIPPSVTNAVEIAAGGQFSVAVRGDGSVAVWGDNTGGQTNVPASATNIVAAAAGWNHVAALRSDGTLLIWGYLSHAPPASNIVQVACGANHVLALNPKGTIWSTGNNTYGQINVPAAATNISSVAGTVYSSLASVGEGPPVLASSLVDRTVVSGATAYFRAYAYGALPMSYQWRFHGTNVDGATNSVFAVPGIQPAQTGHCSVVVTNTLGAITSADCFVHVVPLIINTHPTSQAAYVGENITFGVGAAGQGPLAYQWHFNGADVSGATSSSLNLMNVQIADAGLYSVTVSNMYTSLLSSNASLSVTPILINTEPQSQSIFPGGTVTLSISAIANSPLAYQWLFNASALAGATASSLSLTNVAYGQAGIYDVTLTINGATTNSTDTILSVVPVAAWGWNPAGETTVPLGLTNVAALACSDTRSLALKTDGTIVSWGQLYSATPPPGTSNIVAIAAGNSQTAAIMTDGTVVVWGSNSFGETNVPPELTNAIALAAGEEHTVALRSDGRVFAWGRNWEGQTNVPGGLSNVVAVAAGEWKSLALKADGTVVTWGFNGASQTNPPPGLTNVVAIAGASYHSLALLDNGQVVSWGDSSWGENSLSVTDAIAIAAGYACSLALRAGGTVVAQGYPYSGQTNIPVGLANVQTLTSGENHCLATVGDAPPPIFSPLASPSWTTNCFSVAVPSRNGHVYRLEYKNLLSDSSWFPLPLVAGTGQTLRLLDPTAGGVQRFYRVRQW